MDHDIIAGGVEISIPKGMIPWRQAASQENVHYRSYYERSVQYRTALFMGQIIVDLFIFVYLHIVIKIVQFIQTVQIVQYC